MDLSRWPGTLWEPEGNFCVHCKREYSYHGATEIVTRKLGFRMNLRQLLCRPPDDINTEHDAFGSWETFSKDHAQSGQVTIVRSNDR